MLKILKRMNRSDSGSESDQEDKASSKGLNRVHRLRRSVRKHPDKICREFRARVMRDLSVRNDLQPWSYEDWAKKNLAVFGKMKGLWRDYHGMCSVLEEMENGDIKVARASLVQLIKANLQVALDHGGWENAQLLLPWPDPLARA
eukprot:7921458-Karenia_brevis.AAC.1